MKYLTTILCWLVLFSAPARAELIIEITEGITDATSIAIVPFAWSGPRLSEDVAAIVMHSMANMSIKQRQQQC